MTLWAIADLHLSFGNPEKKMDVFGEKWHHYQEKIEKGWKESVGKDDLVLIPGDISWAKTIDEVKVDLKWLHSLPGTKVMIKGNHDSWWSSISKVRSILPPSCFVIQNDAFNWNDSISIGGARLWDTKEIDYSSFIEFTGEVPSPDHEENERIYARELQRLEMSLKALNPKAALKIALTHYPPLGPDLKESEATKLLEKYGVHLCLFGHLHNVKKGELKGLKREGIDYILTAADFLDFCPLKISL